MAILNTPREIKIFCIVLTGLIVVAVALFLGLKFGYFDQVDQETIVFKVPEKKSLTYGDDLNTDDWMVEYYTHDKSFKTERLQISEFNPEKIGTQTIVLTFAGQTHEIQVTILPKQLDVPNIRLSNDNLVWNSVANAQKYFVCISTEDGTVEAVYETSLQEFDLSSIAEFGALNVCVVAASSDARFVDSERSSAISFTKANGVDGVVYDGQKLVWNAVEDAISYTLIVNNQIISNILDTYFVVDLNPGINSIKVNAVFEESQHIITTKKEVIFNRLNGVERIDAVDDTITWDGIEGADIYDIYLDGELVGSQQQTSINVGHLTPGIYDFAIVVKGKDFIPSRISHFEAMVNAVPAINGDKLLFNLSGECKFNLFIDDKIVLGPVGSIEIDLNSVITTVGDHSVYVQALVENISIGKTQTITITKLVAPTISFENGELSAVGGKNVQWYLNGAPFDGDISVLAEIGTYTITAKSIAGENELDSATSNIITITKLVAPTISFENGELRVVGGKNVQWYKNGVPFDGQASSLIDAGTYTITAKSIAGENELDSATSNTITITKLAAPTISFENGVLRAVGGKNVQWYLEGVPFDGKASSLIDAGTYTVTAKSIAGENELDSSFSNTINVTRLSAPVITFEDGALTCTGGKNVQWYKNGVPFDGNASSLVDAGTYTITAKSIAGDNELDSSFSNTINVTRLSAPVIAFEDGALICTGGKNVQWYKNGVPFDGDINKLVNAGTYTITAKSIAGENELDSATSNTITITKLAAPTISFENGELSAVGGKNVQWYKNGVPFDGKASSLVEAGTYTVTAKSIAGDNELDSSFSNTINVTRLSAPVITFEDGALTCTGGKNVQWYKNGEPFDGQASSLIDAGTYTITAKSIAGENELDSSFSNTLNITKLAEPQISLGNNKIEVQGGDEDIAYYYDGIEFDGDISSLPAGMYDIYAIRVSSDDMTINSNISNVIKTYHAGVGVKVSPTTANRVRINVSHKIEDDNFDCIVNVEFYNGDELIDQLNDVNVANLVSYNRGGTIATKIVIHIKVICPLGYESGAIVKEYDI